MSATFRNWVVKSRPSTVTPRWPDDHGSWAPGRHRRARFVRSAGSSLVPPDLLPAGTLQFASEPNPVVAVVTIVVAVLNEENHIGELVRSILAQDIDEPLELLLIDGMSTDGTRDRIRAILEQPQVRNRQVRLLDNPQRRAPYAFNIGIREAAGEFFCLFGAHASFKSNYVRECVDAVRASPDRVAYGGLIHTLSDGSLQGNLNVDVLTNPFGSSRSSFRTQGAGTVDNIGFPVLRTTELRDAGGYDERLHRNGDNEMNSRLIARGVQLRITDATTASYYPVETAMKLLSYGRRNGWWNARTTALGLSGLRARHFIPAAFLIGLVGSAVLGVVGTGSVRWLGVVGLLGGLGANLALGAKATLATTNQATGAARLLVPPLILAFHVAYGFGTISYLYSKTEPGVG